MDELFDSHFHIIDPRFQLEVNQGFLPDPFTVDAYRAETEALKVTGGVVVSASFQALDQDYLYAALAALGPGFVAVAQLPPTVSDDQLRHLDEAGVRGVRFNLFRGGSATVDDLERLADRIHERFGWHAQIYCSGAQLSELEPLLCRLPRVVIDHLGMDRDGTDALLRLVAGGARVKATGFGRVDLDVAATLRAVAEIDPTALMFGTDLPSTRARRPFAASDIELIRQVLGPQSAGLALHDNARAWYGLGQPQRASH